MLSIIDFIDCPHRSVERACSYSGTVIRDRSLFSGGGGGGEGLLIFGGGSVFFQLKFGEGHFFARWI